MADLPPCGLYRTTVALDTHVHAGRLVYFHDHGDPGPGVYLPARWTANRVEWHDAGHTVPSAEWARSLAPLPPEGFYRVRETFTCCAQRCRAFEPDLLVQLGYDAEAQPILFVPEWTARGLALPDTGTRLDGARLAHLAPLKVAEARDDVRPGALPA
jgi:hypothetical protein